ncbi:MAG: FAD:protein FMN transferase [Pseudomonadota bacterium]
MTVRVLVPPRIGGPLPEADASVARLEGRSMGCDWSVTFVSTPATDVALLSQGIQSVLAQVVGQMSTWEPESAITRFNRAAPGSWLPLPQKFALVLACALYVARTTGGALDPTAGALVTLWGFGPVRRHGQPGFAVPASAAIESARQRCGWQRLQVDVNAMRIHQAGETELDLSAVAKGFAVDEVGRFLRSAGVAHHLVDIGGELRGAGVKPDGQPWWVDIGMPPGVAGITPTRIALHGLSVATSGDYRQGFSANGRRYGHCIDPRSGFPIDNGVCSVTVAHTDCMLADAWSTALMVLGPEAGMVVAEAEHIAAQWLVRASADIEEHCSSAYRALIV